MCLPLIKVAHGRAESCRVAQVGTPIERNVTAHPENAMAPTALWQVRAFRVLLLRIYYRGFATTGVLIPGFYYGAKREEVGVNYWPFQAGGARAQGERSPNPGPEHLFILAKITNKFFYQKVLGPLTFF